MIPSLFTGGSLIAPSSALITSGYVAGNTLGAQHFNWCWNHVTVELNNLLTAGALSQNSAVDTQVRDAILALGGQAYLHINSGSPYSLLLTTLIGTLEVSTGATTFTVVLPSAASAYAIGYEVDIRKDDAGDGVGTTNKVHVTCQSGDYLANVLNGVWDVTEQYGHVKLRAVKIGANYNWTVVSCDGTVYRNVITATQSQSSPTQNTWYNKGGSLALSPGVYELSWGASIQGIGVSAVGGTLSTANNSASDTDFNSYQDNNITVGNNVSSHYRRKRVVVAASTTFYLNIGTNTASGTTISFIGSGSGMGPSNTIIEAKRVG
jgi:hypothetical protein